MRIECFVSSQRKQDLNAKQQLYIGPYHFQHNLVQSKAKASPTIIYKIFQLSKKKLKQFVKFLLYLKICILVVCCVLQIKSVFIIYVSMVIYSLIQTVVISQRLFKPGSRDGRRSGFYLRRDCPPGIRSCHAD